MRGFFIEDNERLQFDFNSTEVREPNLQNVLKCPVWQNLDLIFQVHVFSRWSPGFRVNQLENKKCRSDRHHFPVGVLASCNLPPLPGSSCPLCGCQSLWHYFPSSSTWVFSISNLCRSSPVQLWFLHVPWWQLLLWWAPTISHPELLHCDGRCSWAFPLLIKRSWMSSARTWTTLSVTPLACRNVLQGITMVCNSFHELLSLCF